MSKRKISSYFRREIETDEAIDKAEEKTENDFHKEWTQVGKVRK